MMTSTRNIRTSAARARGQRLSSAPRMAGALLAVVLLALVPGAALADQLGGQTPTVNADAPRGLAASPARLEIGVPMTASDVSLEVAVTNRGPRPAHVHAALADLIVTHAGAYEAAPSGETPYSVAKVATLEQQDLALDSSGLPGATAKVHVAAALDGLARPLYGALMLELHDQVPPVIHLDGVSISPETVPSILIPVMFVPLDEAGAGAQDGQPIGASQLSDRISLALEGVAVSVGQAGQTGPLDTLIPVSLPGVADHGPLVATTSVRNVGNAFGRAFTRYSFGAVQPLGWLPDKLRNGVGLDERPFLETESAPAPLMPDMVGDTRVTSTYATGHGGELDSTPWFGLVRVRASTSLVLADFVTEPVVQETYVLVLPWKEASVGAAAWWLWRLVRGRRRRVVLAAIHPVETELARAA